MQNKIYKKIINYNISEKGDFSEIIRKIQSLNFDFLPNYYSNNYRM